MSTQLTVNGRSGEVDAPADTDPRPADLEA